MMTPLVLSLIGIVTFFLAAWTFWWLRHTMRQLMQAPTQENPLWPVAYQDLSRQVEALHQSMGQMANSVQAMGNQVQHLSVLAGAALQGFQEDYQNQDASRTPPLLIQLRRQADPPYGNDDEAEEHARILTPEDLSPEMLARFKTFQAIYYAIVQGNPLPSRQRPDQN